MALSALNPVELRPNLPPDLDFSRLIFELVKPWVLKRMVPSLQMRESQ